MIIIEGGKEYNVNNGWLCKCGEWVKNSSRSHEIFLMGLREGFKREKHDKIIFSDKPAIKCVCCECGKPTDRNINGEYVCYDCYDYDEKYGYKSYISNNFVIALGLMILNCSINFNPDKLICRDGSCYRDCGIHHVLEDPKDLKNEVRLDDFMVH